MVTLANIYAPNNNQLPFMESLLEELANMLIVGGELNVAMYPLLDVLRKASYVE